MQVTIALRHCTEKHCGIQHIVIEREIVYRNQSDSGFFLQVPVGSTQLLCGLLQFLCCDLISEILLAGKLQFPKAANSGKSNDRCFHNSLHFCGFHVVFIVSIIPAIW